LWGRGCLYLFIAALLTLRTHTHTDTIYTIYFLCLGLVDVCVGIHTHSQLNQLKGTLMEDEKLIRAKFERSDFERQVGVWVCVCVYI
jgi:hypothetical protein